MPAEPGNGGGTPTPAPAPAFRPVLLTAWEPEAALAYPWHGRVAVSVDFAYRPRVLAALGTVPVHAAWGDCDRTPADEVVAFAAEHQLAAIGQAESESQARSALDAGITELVGNAADLSSSMRVEIVARGVVFHQECYWGDGFGAPSTVSAGGIPARLCVGVYPACLSAEAYVQDMPALAVEGGPLGAVYLAEGGDWSPLIPS